MRILVTGAAGFLGSHLTDRLLGEGHTVVGVDNLSTGDGENIAHLAGEPRFQFERHDICQPFGPEFNPGPLDYVFNMASPASPPEYLRLGIETLRVGSIGTENSSGDRCPAWRRVSPSIHIGVLRRPAPASTDRGILGPREPGRTALGLR
jgi:NAD(P)-dependent dehydrogenase (short-subunit alcohol dehydrogenase family)